MKKAILDLKRKYFNYKKASPLKKLRMSKFYGVKVCSKAECKETDLILGVWLLINSVILVFIYYL